MTAHVLSGSGMLVLLSPRLRPMAMSLRRHTKRSRSHLRAPAARDRALVERRLLPCSMSGSLRVAGRGSWSRAAGGRVTGTKNLNLWYSEMWKAGLFGQRKKGRIGKARKDIERSCDKTWAILTPRSAHLAMKNAGASIRIGRLGKYDAR